MWPAVCFVMLRFLQMCIGRGTLSLQSPAFDVATYDATKAEGNSEAKMTSTVFFFSLHVLFYLADCRISEAERDITHCVALYELYRRVMVSNFDWTSSTATRPIAQVRSHHHMLHVSKRTLWVGREKCGTLDLQCSMECPWSRKYFKGNNKQFPIALLKFRMRSFCSKLVCLIYTLFFLSKQNSNVPFFFYLCLKGVLWSSYCTLF